MEDEQKTELGFADIMKELGKIMESLQKIMQTQTEPEPEPEPEQEPTPAPQPKPETETETETETEDEKTEVGDAEEIDKILKDSQEVNKCKHQQTQIKTF